VFDIARVPDGRLRHSLEFLVFLTMGCVIGIGITQPGTAAQAITAGMAWTGFLAKRV
jgi:hypothetical protein